MKKILVPTDFSEEADKALVYARDLALKMEAEIYFLHVMESANVMGSGLFPAEPGVDSEMDLFTLKLMEVRTKEMKKRALSSLYIGITTHMKIIVGSVFAEVKNFILDNNIDLVVMGSKGSSGLEEIFVGSNAERLVRQVPAPVLVVKNEAETFGPINILYPTDCSAGAEESVAILNQFSAAFEAEVKVLHINTPSNFYSTSSSTKMLKEFVEELGIKRATVHSINDLSEEEGILSFATENQVDLIVMASRGRTGVSRLVTGSVATDIVNHSQLPVLVAKLK